MKTFEYKGIKYAGEPSIEIFMRVVKDYEEELKRVKEELDLPETRLKSNILLVKDGVYLNVDDSFVLECDDVYDLYNTNIKFVINVGTKAYDVKFTISVNYDNISNCPPINKMIKDFRENKDDKDVEKILIKEINKVIYNWVLYPNTDKTLEEFLSDYLTY